mmetsp:Transcript_28614/g.37488  ORF Transcript_28614/g.37488 Transcript_28614/m.37488 type:complete len:398 (+) Transcript_28614:40-1233(+)
MVETMPRQLLTNIVRTVGRNKLSGCSFSFMLGFQRPSCQLFVFDRKLSFYATENSQKHHYSNRMGKQCSKHARQVNTISVGKRSDLPLDVNVRDVVIIGSGPAGYTAGIYAARAMLRPLMFAGYSYGGQLMLTSDIENYPGFPTGLGGPDLMEKLREQAKHFGTDIIDRDVEDVDLKERPFRITVSGENHYANSIIISTGAEAQWLNAKNEDKVKGRGVSTCATCDGAFYQGEKVVVIGGGDAAMEEANFLTKFAEHVTILHRRDFFRASAIEQERAENNPKITIRTFAIVKEWLVGDTGNLKGGVIEDPRTGEKETMDFTGAFIAIGHKPLTKFLKGQVDCDSEGYITPVQHTMTNVPGVFAAGDVVDKRYRQAITAAGMGCQAAIDMERWLIENK